MDSRSLLPDNIEPEHCPEAVREWYRLTGLDDRKESAGRKDLALKAKQHLLLLGWKIWYIDKKCKRELRYTSPNNGKTHISLRKACKSCIEEGGCSLKHPSAGAPAAATIISLSPSQSKKRPRESEEAVARAFSFSQLQPKERQRKSEETAAASTYSSCLLSKERLRESEEEVTTTSIYWSPLQSNEQRRESAEAATTTTIFLSPLQSKERLRESEEAAVISIYSSPLQLKVQPKESEVSVARGFSLSPFQSIERLRASDEAAATTISSSPLQLKEQPRESEEAVVRAFYLSPLQSKERLRECEEAAATLIYSSPLQIKEQQRESDEAASKTISLSPLQSKKQPSESEEAAAIAMSLKSFELTSNEDSESSSFISVKKATVTTLSTSMENEKHVIQSKPEVTNSLGSGKRGKVLKREGIRERYSLVSWLIKNKVLVSGTNVLCRGSNNVVTSGSIFCDGIVCDCCNVNFTLAGFKNHAGCTRPTSSTSIFLEDGRSLLECQREAMSSRDQNDNHCIAEANYEANNDTVCSICGFGRDIVLCDRCPSAFHLSCLDLDRVPDGDWFCPTCCCKICCRPKRKQECTDTNDNNILVCVQCEQKFHFGCVKATGYESSHTESNVKKKNWFCNIVCANRFICLKKLLWKPIKVADNLTWTLLKNVNSDDDGGDFSSDEFSQKKRKLNVALHVLYESFYPTIDALSGRELIRDIVFSRDSVHKRLNFCGFYNVILEKMEEVISVATIRIYGHKVAEIVFVATKKEHRGQGMCRLLMDELEKQLSRLGVESLVLHSSEDAIDTWTKSFGFERMTGKVKRQIVDNTFLEFQDTVMCVKPLKKPKWPYTAWQ